MSDKSRARIQENAYDHRDHSKRNYIDAQDCILYHDRREHGKSHDDYEQQRDASALLVIITAEQVKIDHETEDKDSDKQTLPEEGKTFFRCRSATLVPLPFQ